MAASDSARAEAIGADINQVFSMRSWYFRPPVNDEGRRSGGAGGIRTLDTVLPYTHFPGVRLRPLGHRSACPGLASVGKAAHLGLAGAAGKRRRLRRPRRGPNPVPMTRTIGLPPSADEIEAIARAALARLPEQFAAHLDDVVLLVEDFADGALLLELGIEDPFDLTGVYEGTPMHLRSIEQSGRLPDRIRLFREPILDEWIARGDETLETLVAHVLVHEVGHHFGLSDETMHALEDSVVD